MTDTRKDAGIRWLCDSCRQHFGFEEILTIGQIGVSACDRCGAVGDLSAVRQTWIDRAIAKAANRKR